MSGMINEDVYGEVAARFSGHFGLPHTVAAYAPGRAEVLGNHTDYNEGYVLSAAINLGTFFVAAPSTDGACRLVAGDLMEEESFELTSIAPSSVGSWSNYVRGVVAGLRAREEMPGGFLGMFLGNVPLGSGLSSSAALEVSAGLALSALYDIDLGRQCMARICQTAEHEYAGVKCGLLDQITSLFGLEDRLVMTDFRTLEVSTVPLGGDCCLVICDTAVKHSLVESEYNDRRRKCREAADFFASVLDHPVVALRDVGWDEVEGHRKDMEPVAAKRAAHVVSENERVVRGKELLKSGEIEAFGKLMFESHESSRTSFENSCPELDFLVDRAAGVPGVMGAKLCGGGFGGSVVALAHRRDADVIRQALASAYEKEFGHACVTRAILPAAGAHLVDDSTP
ncbi:galactokinase [Verrucomicrobiota bacterium]